MSRYSEVHRVKCHPDTVDGDIDRDLGDIIEPLQRGTHNPSFLHQPAATSGQLIAFPPTKAAQTGVKGPVRFRAAFCDRGRFRSGKVGALSGLTSSSLFIRIADIRARVGIVSIESEGALLCCLLQCI